MNSQDGHFSEQPPPSPSNGVQQQNYQQPQQQQQQVQIFPGGIGPTTPPNQSYQHQQLRIMRMTLPPGAMGTNMMQWDQPIQTQTHYMTQTITRIHTTRMIVPTANSNIGVPGSEASFRPQFRMVRFNQNQGSRVTGVHAITDGSILVNQTPQGLLIHRKIYQSLQNPGGHGQGQHSSASPCLTQNQQLQIENPVPQLQPLEPTPTVVLQPPRFRAPSHSQSAQMMTPLIGSQSTPPRNGSQTQRLQRSFLRPAQFNPNAMNNIQLINVSSGSGGYPNPRSPVVSVSPVMTPPPPPAIQQRQQVSQLGLGPCDITNNSNAEPTLPLQNDQKPLNNFSGEVSSEQKPLVRPSRFTVDWRPKQPMTPSAPPPLRLGDADAIGVQPKGPIFNSSSGNTSTSSNRSMVSINTPRVKLFQSSNETQPQQQVQFSQLPGLNFNRAKEETVEESDSSNSSRNSDSSRVRKRRRPSSFPTFKPEVPTNQDNNDGNDRNVNTATKPQPKPVAPAANPKKRKGPFKDVPIVTPTAKPDLNDNQPKNEFLHPNAIPIPASSVSKQKKKTKTVAEVAKEVRKEQQASTSTSSEISEKASEKEKVGGAKKQAAATGEGVPKEQDDSRYFTEVTATTSECIRQLILGELKLATAGSSVFNKAVRVKVNRRLCQPSGIFVFDVSILEKDSQSSDYPPAMLQVTNEYPADIPVFLDFQAIAKTISNKRNRQRFEEAVKKFKCKVRGLHDSQLRIHLLILVWSWALIEVTKLPQSYFNGKSQKKKMAGFLDQLMPTTNVKNDAD